MKGQQLEEEDTCMSKYLGVDLSSKLQWKDHIYRSVQKSQQDLGFLCSNLRIRNHDTSQQPTSPLFDLTYSTVHLSGILIQLI